MSKKRLFQDFVLALFFLMILNFLFASNTTLLEQSDLKYVGSFRVPHGKYDPIPQGSIYSTIDMGGSALTYNPLNNSLYIGGHPWAEMIGEISIPDVVNSTIINDLNYATLLTNFVDLSGNEYTLLGPSNNPYIGNGGVVKGYFVYDNKLFGSAYGYYDASCSAILSHFYNGLKWDSDRIFAINYTTDILRMSKNWENNTQVTIYVSSGPNTDGTLRSLPSGLYSHTIYNLSKVNNTYFYLINSTSGIIVNIQNDTNFNLDGSYKYNLVISTNTDFHGFYQVGGHFEVGQNVDTNPELVPQAGFIGGYMGLIPEEWQDAFGGKAISGNGAIAIIGRTSWGPSAFVFNPEDLYNATPNGENNENYINATPILYYPSSHPEIGAYGSDSLYFNGGGDSINAVVFVKNTSTVLFFGKKGIGDYCYGLPVSNSSLHKTYCDEHYPTVYCCYDPLGGGKGNHAYPYVYYVWAYDANDLLKVKNKEALPWEIKPYAIWSWDKDTMPFGYVVSDIKGVAYDEEHQRLYLSIYGGDRGTYSRFPIINVYDIVIPSDGSSDHTSPSLTQMYPVNSPSNDSTPTYSFFTNENATILYFGSCISNTTQAVFGRNDVEFNYLPDGNYTDCKIMLNDSFGNPSVILDVNDFIVQTSENGSTEYHKADLDHSGVIEDSETRSFWQRWMNNLESFSDMFDTFLVWKSGG